MSSDLEKLKAKLRAGKLIHTPVVAAVTPDSSTIVKPVVATDAKPVTKGKQLSCVGLTVSLSRKNILNQISVTFKPGEISAILGPSGSGKSTLLKSLLSLYSPQAGSVLYGGTDMKSCRDEFRASMGYVPQDDIIHRALSVESALYYSSKLRLGSDVTDDDIAGRINTVLAQLGLTDRRKLKISKLSGGQRKRVNIGVELLANPSTLLLDEPASGLDPGTESDLLDHLRHLSNEGRTIAMTTHSMEFLNKVDKIIFLVEGYLLFAGSLEQMMAHFKLEHVSDVYKKVCGANLISLRQEFERSQYYGYNCKSRGY